MISLITNNESNTHTASIKLLLDDATEVYIATAFLKKSGLDLLSQHFSQKHTNFKILAGYNFAITDPAALAELLKHANKSQNLVPYLVNMKLKTVFHSKLYLIRDKYNCCHVIIGSANLTNGGWSKNNELSIYYKCNIDDNIWRESLAYFNDSIKPLNADQLTARIIAIYRNYYNKQKQANIRMKDAKFPKVLGNLIYDLSNLKKRLDALDKIALEIAFNQKREHYKKAKLILEDIISNNYNKAQFQSLLEDLVGKKSDPGLWYSNGMYRHKTEIFEQQKAFKKLIKNIKDNLLKSPEYIYNSAKKLTENIRGVGPNFIGEIMMTYAPEKLANINRNPITVLKKEGGADIKAHSSSFLGNDYEEYNEIITEIRTKLGLKDMLEIDYFFNEIYQDIK